MHLFAIYPPITGFIFFLFLPQAVFAQSDVVEVEIVVTAEVDADTSATSTSDENDVAEVDVVVLVTIEADVSITDIGTEPIATSEVDILVHFPQSESVVENAPNDDDDTTWQAYLFWPT